MNRMLKLVVIGAMALVALGVVGASAQAAEFHCSVEPCRVTAKPDGEGKTAHQLLNISRTAEEGGGNVMFTCFGLTGEVAAAFKTAASLTVTNLAYSQCVFFTAELAFTSNGCDYLLGASGTLSITCPKEKEMEWKGAGCVVKIGAQGPLAGIKIHDASPKGKKEELTIENNVKGIKGTVNSGCLLKEGPFGNGEFLTGNLLLTAETNPGGAMLNIWFE